MLAGNGQTLMAHYSVPRGYTGYITSWRGSMGKAGKVTGAQAELTLRYRKFSPVNTVGTIIESTLELGMDGSSNQPIHYSPYKAVHDKTDVFIRVDATTDNATDITGQMDIIIVADD